MFLIETPRESDGCRGILEESGGRKEKRRRRRVFFRDHDDDDQDVEEEGDPSIIIDRHDVESRDSIEEDDDDVDEQNTSLLVDAILDEDRRHHHRHHHHHQPSEEEEATSEEYFSSEEEAAAAAAAEIVRRRRSSSEEQDFQHHRHHHFSNNSSTHSSIRSSRTNSRSSQSRMHRPDDKEEEDHSQRLRRGRKKIGTRGNPLHRVGMPASLRKQTSATLVRQSQPYVLFNIIVLIALTVLLVWVVVTPGHIPTSPIFVILEVVVTSIVTAEVALEIAHYGCVDYFFPARLPRKASFALKCSRIFLHVWNWFQAFLVLLCLATMFLFLRGAPNSPGGDGAGEDADDEMEEEVEFDGALVLAGLIGRYAFYVAFVCSLQWKVTRSQGGWKCQDFRKALTRCLTCDCHVSPPLKEQWDIFIEKETSAVGR